MRSFISVPSISISISLSLSPPPSQGTIVSVREEVSQAQNMEQRLFFLDSDRNMTDSFEGVLDFEMTNVEEQKNITVYVKVIPRL